MASRREVAELAGVSEATVSRVLNGVGPIREETRRKVLEASERLGYVPSALARSFARSKSGNLGVVLPYVPKAHLFSAYFFSEMLSGIGSKARDNGLDLLVMFQAAGETMNYTDLFRRQKIDSCIILGARHDQDELAAIQQLDREGHPFCIMNQHFAGESFTEVDADHVEGSRLAIRHLTDQGYRNIAFLNGPDIYSNSQDRLEGVRMGLHEAGMELEPSLLFEGNYSRRSGIDAASSIAERLHEIDAVFAANDRMAIGVMHGLRERGVRIEDFPAFVGYDDSDAAEMAVPALSSVRVPFFEMGELAVSKLIQDSHGAVDAKTAVSATDYHPNVIFDTPRTLLPTELIVRASSQRQGRI